MLLDIVANIIILVVLPILCLLAAFGDERETLITAFAIFGVFILCVFLVII